MIKGPGVPGRSWISGTRGANSAPRNTGNGRRPWAAEAPSITGAPDTPERRIRTAVGAGRAQLCRRAFGSVGRFESRTDGGGDTAALTHLVSVLLRPMPDRLGLFLRHRAGRDDLLADAAPGFLDPVAGFDEAFQVLAQPSGVSGAQIDFEIGLVKAEMNGLDVVGRTVEIIHEVGAGDSGHGTRIPPQEPSDDVRTEFGRTEVSTLPIEPAGGKVCARTRRRLPAAECDEIDGAALRASAGIVENGRPAPTIGELTDHHPPSIRGS